MPPLDPLGHPGGLNRSQTPQDGKIKFLATFLENFFSSFLGSLGTLILSPTIPKNWGLTLFWYIFGPKTAKKEHTFMRHSSFGSGWIFYFIAKINYFRPFLWPVFFSNWKIAIQRWAKLKTLGCDTPLFYLLKKKSAKVAFEPTLPCATRQCHALYQLSHQDCWTIKVDFKSINKKKISCS